MSESSNSAAIAVPGSRSSKNSIDSRTRASSSARSASTIPRSSRTRSSTRMRCVVGRAAGALPCASLSETSAAYSCGPRWRTLTWLMPSHYPFRHDPFRSHRFPPSPCAAGGGTRPSVRRFLGGFEHPVGVAAGILPPDVAAVIRFERRLVHPGVPRLEQVAQVADQQIPVEVVRLVALVTVDDQPAGATWLEQRPEDFQVPEVAHHFFAFRRRQRLEVLLVGHTRQLRRRVVGVTGERVERLGIHALEGTRRRKV